MFGRKPPLYIFIHIPKCAGTTVAAIFRSVFPSYEILEFWNGGVYYHLKSRASGTEFMLSSLYIGYRDALKFSQLLKIENKIFYKKRIGQSLESMPLGQKQKIRAILGHGAFYGIHRYFPHHQPYYVLFLRDPLSRVISHYNFLRTQTEDYAKNLLIDKKYKRLSFREWFLAEVARHDFITCALASRSDGFTENDVPMLFEPPSSKIIFLAKDVLSRADFVGFANRPNDFFRLARFIGGKYERQILNVSKKYVLPSQEVLDFLKPKTLIDQEIYNFAKTLPSTLVDISTASKIPYFFRYNAKLTKQRFYHLLRHL